MERAWSTGMFTILPLCRSLESADDEYSLRLNSNRLRPSLAPRARLNGAPESPYSILVDSTRSETKRKNALKHSRPADQPSPR